MIFSSFTLWAALDNNLKCCGSLHLKVQDECFSVCQFFS